MPGTDHDMLSYSTALLDTYSIGLPGWKRFFTGNNSDAPLLYPFNRMWGRHHLREVNRIRMDLNANSELQIQNTVDLLYRLHSIALVNRHGSLAKRINAIWRRLLEQDNIHLLNQEVDRLPPPNDYLTNGLILTIRHRPDDLGQVLHSVLNSPARQKKVSVLKRALMFTMGEHREVLHPTTHERYLEEWHHLAAADVIMNSLEDIDFSDKKTILLSGLLRAYECNREDTYKKILAHLFSKYRQLPSADYLTWIRVVLSSHIKTADEDNTTSLLAALHRAIGETVMRVPTAFQGEVHAIQQILRKDANTKRYVYSLFSGTHKAQGGAASTPVDEDEEVIVIPSCP